MLELEKYIELDKKTIRSPNLTDRFGEEDLSTIGNLVFEGYQRDEESRSTWFKRTNFAMDLAMQVVKEKTFPWVNASNVAFPLLTIAALQFHSRAYPTIISGNEVVRCRIIGEDPDGKLKARSERIARHMSYQVMEEDEAWEEGTDRMLLNIPIVGCAFKKSMYDDILGHNVSELVLARDLVVPYFTKDINSCRRKTHIIPRYRNEIYEKCESGVYRDVRDEGWYTSPPEQKEAPQGQDDRQGLTDERDDDSAPFTLLEQHCWLDLDGDGYEEPYVVMIELTSKAVLRIVSRVDREEDISRSPSGHIAGIKAAEYFTKYGFIPSPDGGFYDVGFGILIGPLNESVNSLVNQLTDAGTMSNTAGGFIGRGAKIRSGAYSFSPMEWKRVDSTGDDLKKNIMPLPVREPSNVLFQLLSLLIDYTNRISGATEMLAGQNPGQNTPAATSDHMVEQGLKIYSAIFKRVWRSMKEEFKKLYILNAINMPLRKPFSGGFVAMREDYLGDPNQIVPVADPNVVSDTIRFMQAKALAERAMTVPGYDKEAVEKNFLKALKIDGWETFYIGIQKTGPLPNPKVQIEQIKIQGIQAKLKHDGEKFAIEAMQQHDLNEAHIKQMEAAATKLLADAKGVDVGQQISAINAMIGAAKTHNENLHRRIELMLKEKEINNAQQGDVPGVADQPGNGGGSKVPPQAS